MAVEKELSVLRLRLGVFMFVLWWIPIYLAAPAIITFLGLGGDPKARNQVILAIVLVQSAIGIVGFMLIGKTVTELLRHSSYKKLPKLVWKLFWSGHIPPQAN